MPKITGDKADETFIALDGVSYNGLGGSDTLVFTGSFNDYAIASAGTGNIKTEVAWDDGSLDTKWIESFAFSDGIFDVATLQFTPNDIPPPSITISDGQAVEGQPLLFTISLSHVSDENVTVTYSTQPGTAFGMGNDFFGTPGTTVTIPAGELSVQISIGTLDDSNVEPDETFFVNLTNPVGGTIVDGQGIGTIPNNDTPPPHITMTVVDSQVTEGETVQYLFELTGGDPDSAFEFTWDYLPPLPLGAAVPGDDFVAPSSHVVHFEPGQTQVLLEFPTFADELSEGTEAFAISFVPETTYTFTVVSNIAQIVDSESSALLG